MDCEGPFCYTILLSCTEDKRIISKKDIEGKITNFKHPITAQRVPKIYILKQNEELVYVGYASQSIGTRLGQGIRANGGNGYHGYKWKQTEELQLLVFVFSQQLKGKKNDADKPYILLAEAIEAELVYLIREETGKWPRFQNEIHFNNENLEKAKEIAAEIYLAVGEESKFNVEQPYLATAKVNRQ